MSEPVLLFATRAYASLHRMILSDTVQPGALERRHFPDGERYVRIRSAVRDRHVAVLGGTIDDESTLELFDLASGLVQEGCRSLTLLIPYFGYSTMERQGQPGELVTAKLRARLLSAIPSPGDGLRVVLIDLHAPGLPWYFEGPLQPVHLMPWRCLQTAARELAAGEPFVLGAVDAGGAKRVQKLANRLGVQAGFVFKQRLSGEAVRFTALHADVEGRPVILCDDMVRTGGTLLNAARAYRDAGATRIAAIATHGVLPGDALDRLRDSDLLEAIIVTDSHPRALALEDGFLRVVTLAGLLEHWLDHHLPSRWRPDEDRP